MCNPAAMGKPPSAASSYRPVALLSPLAKALEKIVLLSLQAHLPPADHQHGFRNGRSTTSALEVIIDFIRSGLNLHKPVDRTILVAIDLTRSYETVRIEVLLADVLLSSLPGFIKRWLSAYLRGRQVRTEYRDAVSPSLKARLGLPQWSVIAPCLFNFYMASLPLPELDDMKASPTQTTSPCWPRVQSSPPSARS